MIEERGGGGGKLAVAAPGDKERALQLNALQGNADQESGGQVFGNYQGREDRNPETGPDPLTDGFAAVHLGDDLQAGGFESPFPERLGQNRPAPGKDRPILSKTDLQAIKIPLFDRTKQIP